jgi:hypothetical protein
LVALRYAAGFTLQFLSEFRVAGRWGHLNN